MNNIKNLWKIKTLVKELNEDINRHMIKKTERLYYR